jgi:hypothetical protein
MSSAKWLMLSRFMTPASSASGGEGKRSHPDSGRWGDADAGASLDDDAGIAQRARERAGGEGRGLRDDEGVDFRFRSGADPSTHADQAIVTARDDHLRTATSRARRGRIGDLERGGCGLEPDRPGPTGGAGRDHDVDEVLIERERRHTRRVRGVQVTREPPVRHRLCLERMIVADDVARHAADARGRDLPGECAHRPVAVAVVIAA